MGRLTPDQQRAWQRQCAERKAAEHALELDEAEKCVKDALGPDAFLALERWLDLREVKG